MKKFLNPSLILDYLSSGGIYVNLTFFCFFILTILNWIFPCLVAYVAFKERIFTLPALEILCFVLVFLVMIFCFSIGGRLWYIFSKNILLISPKHTTLQVTSILSMFFKTLGEWTLIIFGMFGTAVVCMGSFFLTDIDYREAFNSLGFPYITTKWQVIIFMPLLSFLISTASKFISEILLFTHGRNSQINNF